ncbi:hypothetical protein ACFQX6_02260 [Streptosporangium lutulentum]
MIVAEGTPQELKGGTGTLDDVFLSITGRSLRDDPASGESPVASGTAGE